MLFIGVDFRVKLRIREKKKQFFPSPLRRFLGVKECDVNRECSVNCYMKSIESINT